MHRDRVIITVVAIVVFSAIIFGFLMAYRTYKLPMPVYDIDNMILVLKGGKNNNKATIPVRFYMFKELSRSCKMKNTKTGEIRKFTKEEMEDFNNAIGGKEAVINYLNSIENEEQKKEEVDYACYTLKIITSDESVQILNKQ